MIPPLRTLRTIALLLGLPLAGGYFAGYPEGFGAFPPLVHREPIHPPFSWPVWLVFAALALVFAWMILRPAHFGMRPRRPVEPNHRAAFPAWGYAGLVLNLAAWLVAWRIVPAPEVVARHTFFPLWLGYILAVDGVVYRRTAVSLVATNRRTFLVLFPASAVVWWYFEYLNRFIQNWWYQGADFTPLHYVLHATLCFSTVFPAVFETADLLRSTRRFRTFYSHGPSLPGLHRPAALRAFVLAGIALLFLVPFFPHQLFWAVWLAPLFIVYPALVANGVKRPLGDLPGGHYNRLATLAIAALICGFFWELWNYWSLPKWNYGVPYVYRFLLFEMPIVGYAGYLPFGPYCWCAWLLMRGRRED